MIEIKPIGYIHTGFMQKFGIPRQSGLASNAIGVIEFADEYKGLDFIKGIEEFDYLWLIWQFSANVRDNHNPTVRPPRLGGEETKGVFATRSPFRPNNMGLSSVKLEAVVTNPTEGNSSDWTGYIKDVFNGESINGPYLVVSGVDMLDGTPIFDIKPYVEYADSHVGIRSGFADSKPASVKVEFCQELQAAVDAIEVEDEELIAAKMGLSLSCEQLKRAVKLLPEVKEILSQDPRAAYDRKIDRSFKLAYGGFDFEFESIEDGFVINSIAVYGEK